MQGNGGRRKGRLKEKGMGGGEEELEPRNTTVDQAAGRRC